MTAAAGGGAGAGLGPWGMALAGVGTMAEGYGQGQALDAMHQVWQDAMNRQNGFDDQLDARTREYLNQLTMEKLLGTEQINRTAGSMKTSRDTLAGAVKMNNAQGGRRAPLVGETSSLADVIRAQQGRDAIGARIGGFETGARDISQMGNQFAGDRNRVIRDAQLWQQLVPYQLRAAQQEGGAWRGVGQGMQGIGNGMAMWDMSGPGGGEAVPEQAYESTNPLLAHQPGYGDPGTGVQASRPTPTQQHLNYSMQPTYTDLFGGYR